jgi:hypothetical protein
MVAPQISIGFRVSPTEVCYAVVSREKNGPFAVMAAEVLAYPKAMTPPQQLHFVRNSVGDLAAETSATFAGIKLAETVSKPTPFRLNVEGVIQEALASKALEHFFFGTIASFSRAFGHTDRKLMKLILEGKVAFDFVPLGGFSREHRDAIAAAIAAILDHGN